jgi:hypothetical protein
MIINDAQHKVENKTWAQGWCNPESEVREETAKDRGGGSGLTDRPRRD